jgi:FkbM family methyltransferase
MNRRLLAISILAIAGVASLIYFYRDSAPVRFARVAMKRDKHCSLRDTWSAIQADTRLWDRIDEINEDARLIQSDPAGFELIEAEESRYWIPRGNRAGLAEMLGEQERDVYRLDAGVRPGDVVLDCGANVGVFTRHALDKGARRVVAIELAPENIECLRRNFAEQVASGEVIIYPKGVWDKDDVLQLHTSTLTGGDSVALNYPGSNAGTLVQLTTIDKLVSELKLDRVDFIKMDIEGAEKKALAGARQTVARFRPAVAVSMEHLPDDTESIPTLVKNLWPDATVVCGPCTWVHTALVDHVAPEELFVKH